MGVVGQGYVGLTLAAVAADQGFSVIGMDIDTPRIEGLRSGALVAPGVNEHVFQAGVNSGRLDFSSDPDVLIGTDVVVICVPTPVRDQAPDLSYVEHASYMVADRLSAGQLVILESTTYPGTTDELVKPILESSGLVAGRDFLLAYSPERIDPGNEEYEFRSIPRIVGGLSAESTGAASLFYGQLVDKVVQVGSCRAAELAKLLENTFRHVNVALVNEMAMLCHETGIDVWEVIHAAETKPFGFMAFQPGPGVGGHCIPLDPTYLAWQIRRDAGRHFRILEQAQDINTQMPRYVGSRIADALNDDGKSVRGANILVLGIAYKPDVGDVRESPALEVMAHLMRRGAQLTYHDPTISAVRIDDKLLYSSPLSRKAIASADCVALLTPHSSYDLSWIAEHAGVIFDARNAYDDDRRPNVVRL